MAQPSNQEEIATCFQSSTQPEICNLNSGTLRSDSGPALTVGKLGSAFGKEEQKIKATTVTGKTVNRCSACRKRVGLSGGFVCRCSKMYCGEHRYSDRHECAFDYKKLGRERIQKDNPLIRAAKVVRI